MCDTNGFKGIVNIRGFKKVRGLVSGKIKSVLNSVNKRAVSHSFTGIGVNLAKTGKNRHRRLACLNQLITPQYNRQ